MVKRCSNLEDKKVPQSIERYEKTTNADTTIADSKFWQHRQMG